MANRPHWGLVPLFLTALIPVLSCGGGLPQFDGSRAYDHLLAQCEFGPRNPGSLGHDRTREYLVEHLSQYANRVEQQRFSFRDEELDSAFQLTNIVACFYPEQTHRVILCAHWDTRPRADRDSNLANRGVPILGANDGASGVAVLLELASTLRQRKPKYGIDLVLFDGEDYGEEGDLDHYLLGSSHFANHLGAHKYEFGILLDMVGDRELTIYVEGHSLLYAPELVKLIWDKASELGMREFRPQVGPTLLDDHIPLNSIGIPTVDLIDFDYPYWHTLEDTPDKCSPSSLQLIGSLLIALIYQ